MTDKDTRYPEIMKLVLPECWPDDITMHYREQELKDMCDLFSSYCEVIHPFRDFKDSEGKHVSETMKKLLKCVEKIPVSNAEWELGFSIMNNIMTLTRNVPTVEKVSSLLTVNSCCPPISQWDPLLYIC